MAAATATMVEKDSEEWRKMEEVARALRNARQIVLIVGDGIMGAPGP